MQKMLLVLRSLSLPLPNAHCPIRNLYVCILCSDYLYAAHGRVIATFRPCRRFY